MKQKPLNMKKPDDRQQSPIPNYGPRDSGHRRAVAWRSWEADAEKLKIEEADGIMANLH